MIPIPKLPVVRIQAIQVLRLSHRLPRDERISTHVALVARAFGASSVFYTGQHDVGLESSVSRIVEHWGSLEANEAEKKEPAAKGGETKKCEAKECGKFSITYEKSVTSFLKNRKREGWCIVHLTMYGLPINQVLGDIKPRDRIVVVVGSEQVPREIYELADFNISITNQPHSEVAALAITLDRLVDGRELGGNGGIGFDFGGKLKIIPSERGKQVVKSGLP